MDGSRGWNRIIEALAFGDTDLLAKMKEIASWYDSYEALVLQSKAEIFCTTEYERDRIRAAYGGDTHVSAMEIFLWCMSEAHGWDFDLAHKYEDYRSVIPADEVPDVKWTGPVVLPGTSVDNPIYIREEGMPIPVPPTASPAKWPYFSEDFSA